jgi:hypothetical protein
MRPSNRRHILPDFTHHLLSLEETTAKDELFEVGRGYPREDALPGV